MESISRYPETGTGQRTHRRPLRGQRHPAAGLALRETHTCRGRASYKPIHTDSVNHHSRLQFIVVFVHINQIAAEDTFSHCLIQVHFHHRQFNLNLSDQSPAFIVGQAKPILHGAVRFDKMQIVCRFRDNQHRISKRSGFCFIAKIGIIKCGGIFWKNAVAAYFAVVLRQFPASDCILKARSMNNPAILQQGEPVLHCECLPIDEALIQLRVCSFL